MTDSRIEIAVGAELATVTLTGVVSEDVLRRVFESLFGNPDFKPGMMVLADVTGAELDLPAAALARTIEYLERHRTRRGNGKEAIVVGRTVDYGVGRMIEAYIEDPLPFEIRVFQTLEEARQWLGV